MANPIQWLRQCSRDPQSPARLTKGTLGILTGQDTRALLAIGACWELYSNSDADGQRAAIAAIRVLLSGMQAKCHFLARELIAYALDWQDRDRLWPLVSQTEERETDPAIPALHTVTLTRAQLRDNADAAWNAGYQAHREGRQQHSPYRDRQDTSPC